MLLLDPRFGIPIGQLHQTNTSSKCVFFGSRKLDGQEALNGVWELDSVAVTVRQLGLILGGPIAPNSCRRTFVHFASGPPSLTPLHRLTERRYSASWTPS
uniref:Uncharacterized protein n=1 Tax=Rhodosorus marinus TaxID=101924 RepID=A0A7S2ZEV2_9RHOD